MVKAQKFIELQDYTPSVGEELRIQFNRCVINNGDGV